MWWGKGSSPQARGTRERGAGGCLEGGIIPAGAGNSRAARSVLMRVRDHPRRRGELPFVKRDPARFLGSSPQARGTPHTHGYRRRAVRIIPAGAGNSHSDPECLGAWRDHPRRRGELSTPTRRVTSPAGSSPQARGTPHTHGYRRRAVRIIPAGAGNSP